MTDRKIVIALTEDHRMQAAALASDTPFDIGMVTDIGEDYVTVRVPISQVRMSTHILERVKGKTEVAP